MTGVVRHCTDSDAFGFMELWREYLLEAEKRGSYVLASNRALEQAMEIWAGVVKGTIDGVSLIVPGVAVNLWGPAFPLPVKDGPMMMGQGTYVRPDHRRSGVGAEMYRQGFEILRDKGYRLFSGSVDAGNGLGERNAMRLNSRLIQELRVVEL